MSHILQIKVADDCPNMDSVVSYYQTKAKSQSYVDDCGVDLVFPDNVDLMPHAVTKCNMGIACQLNHGPFMLVARSSIANTPLMLANGIGIIDPQYRGPIIGAFRSFSDEPYTAKQGDRLLQIVAFDGKPIQVQLVDELTTTQRGANGFGSTN